MKTIRVLSLFLLYLSPIVGILLFGGLIFFGQNYYNNLDFLKIPFDILNKFYQQLKSNTNMSLSFFGLGYILLFSNVISGLLYLPLISVPSNRAIKLWGVINTFIMALVITVLSVFFVYCIFAPLNSPFAPYNFNYSLSWSPFLFLLPAVLIWLGFILATIHFALVLRHTKEKKLPSSFKTPNKIEINNYHVHEASLKKDTPYHNHNHHGSTKDEAKPLTLQEKVEKLRQKLGTNENNINEFSREKYPNANKTNGMYYQTINKNNKNVVHQSESGHRMVEREQINHHEDHDKNINAKFMAKDKNKNYSNINAKFTINNKKNMQDGEKIWNATKLYRQDIVNKNKSKKDEEK